MSQPNEPKLLYREEVYRINGAAFEVHNHLGCGFLEGIYEEALIHEFRLQGIPFKSQVALPVRYKGELLRKRYRVDLICFDAIVIELKAIPVITKYEHAQLLNYIKAGAFQLGLLFNFGEPRLYSKRIVNEIAEQSQGTLESLI